MNRLPGFSSSTGTPSMVWRFRSPCAPWPFVRCGHRSTKRNYTSTPFYVAHRCEANSLYILTLRRYVSPKTVWQIWPQAGGRTICPASCTRSIRCWLSQGDEHALEVDPPVSRRAVGRRVTEQRLTLTSRASPHWQRRRRKLRAFVRLRVHSRSRLLLENPRPLQCLPN